MPKVAALVRSFNAGEFSKLLEGRVDLEKYPASLRYSRNFVPTPHGPVVRRSGTKLEGVVYNEATHSALIPFIPSADQAQAIEFANLAIRFHSEAGISAFTPVVITAVDNLSAFVKFTAAGHGLVVNDYTVLQGFAFTTNLNGRIVKVTAVAGNDVTTDLAKPAAYGSIATATSAKVYQIVSPYSEADVQSIRFEADEDVLYLFCDGYAPQQLQRYGAYDWRLSQINFVDGPYDSTNETATRITPSATGNKVPNMAADASGGYTSSSSGASATHEAYRAFDGDRTTYWESSASQTGILQIQFPAGDTVDGYVIEMAVVNNDASYKSLDYAPGDFKFEGSSDGATWTLLDTQVGYVLYDNNRSAYFALKNNTAFVYYRLNITRCTRNGALPPRVAGLVLTTRAAAAITLTASAVTGINQDRGFLATDVGRLVRLRGNEGTWRSLKITGRTSTTVVSASYQNDVMSSVDSSAEWRLGLFSATTGYPTCACFFEDRLWLGGMGGYPDWFAASVVGKYTTFSPTSAAGLVQDDNGIAAKLNSRRKGRVSWIATDGKAVLIGTSAGEWSVRSNDPQSALTARTAKARRATVRGSAAVEPIQVDNQILFVQRGNRTLREMAYAFSDDSYHTPSMSLFASHIGVNTIKQQDFAYEPYSIDWLRYADGSLVGFTYMREENVISWHPHTLADGGLVESLCVLPSQSTTQDVLWMVVKRGAHRFIERMMPLWDFGMARNDAFYVDAGIPYNGAAITDVYGLWMHEGSTVYGIADGVPITPAVVVGGKITLPDPASQITLGLGFDSVLETARGDEGAANGTAQGKWKRVISLRMRLWDSVGGQYMTRDHDNAQRDYVDIPNLDPTFLATMQLLLFSGDTLPLDQQPDHNTDGTIFVKQDKSFPLPFNLVALMPIRETQDGG